LQVLRRHGGIAAPPHDPRSPAFVGLGFRVTPRIALYGLVFALPYGPAMMKYDEAFHETVLEAIERTEKRAAELTARTAETAARSQYIRVEARSM
jgi:hypothetical protein